MYRLFFTCHAKKYAFRNIRNEHYYTNARGACEIDFLIDIGGKVVPVEVKAKDWLVNAPRFYQSSRRLTIS